MAQPVTLTDGDFEQNIIKGTKPAMVDFWAQWCGPCRMMGPIVEELAAEYGDKVTIAKMNVDENPQTPAKFSIRSIPTLLFFNKGKLTQQLVGVRPKAELKRLLDGLLG